MVDYLQYIEILRMVTFDCIHGGIELFLVNACLDWVKAKLLGGDVHLGDVHPSSFYRLPVVPFGKCLSALSYMSLLGLHRRLSRVLEAVSRVQVISRLTK